MQHIILNEKLFYDISRTEDDMSCSIWINFHDDLMHEKQIRVLIIPHFLTCVKFCKIYIVHKLYFFMVLLLVRPSHIEKTIVLENLSYETWNSIENYSKVLAIYATPAVILISGAIFTVANLFRFFRKFWVNQLTNEIYTYSAQSWI